MIYLLYYIKAPWYLWNVPLSSAIPSLCWTGLCGIATWQLSYASCCQAWRKLRGVPTVLCVQIISPSSAIPSPVTRSHLHCYVLFFTIVYFYKTTVFKAFTLFFLKKNPKFGYRPETRLKNLSVDSKTIPYWQFLRPYEGG